MKYRGKTIDDAGITQSFPKKQILWKDVIYIKTDSKYAWGDEKYKTTIYTCDADIAIKSAKITFEDMVAHALMLKTILEHCPNAATDARTAYILKWKPAFEEFEHLEKAIKDNPDDISTMMKLATVRALLFDHKRAYKYIKQMLQIQPDNIDAMELKALIEIDKKEFNAKSVTEMYGQLVSRQPEEPRFLRNLAISLLDRDDPAGLDYARQLLRKSEREVRLRLAIRAYYFRREQYNAAIETYQELKKEFGRKQVKFLDKEIEFAAKYSSDPSFRTRTKVKLTGGLVFAIVIFLVGIAFLLLPIIRLVRKLIETFT